MGGNQPWTPGHWGVLRFAPGRREPDDGDVNQSLDMEANRVRLDALSAAVIGMAIAVHRALGPGLLESVYEAAMAHELSQSPLRFQRQVETPVWYKGIKLECGYRTDFTVEDELIIELKAVNELLPVHHAQLLTYLRLQRRTVGLLINFNVPVLKDGIRRIVTGPLFQESRFEPAE